MDFSELKNSILKNSIDLKGFKEYLDFFNLTQPKGYKVRWSNAFNYLEAVYDSWKSDKFPDSIQSRTDICLSISGVYEKPVISRYISEVSGEQNVHFVGDSGADASVYESAVTLEIRPKKQTQYLFINSNQIKDGYVGNGYEEGYKFNEIQKVFDELVAWGNAWKEKGSNNMPTYAVLYDFDYSYFLETLEGNLTVVRFDELIDAIDNSRSLSELTEKISGLERLQSVSLDMDGKVLDIPVDRKLLKRIEEEDKSFAVYKSLAEMKKKAKSKGDIDR